MQALEQVDGWGAHNVSVAVVRGGDVAAVKGDRARVYRWASVTKLITAYAALIAVEEGTLELDEPAGPPGSTVRHLLAHASGLPFEGDVPISPPERRRIYSNTGFVVLAETLADRAGIGFDAYLDAAVVTPLGMDSAELRGHAGAGLHGSLDDLLAFACELHAPTLVAPETLAEATTVQFPGLGGVIPDVGRYEPNDWGLGFELRDGKEPHWTGTHVSERTYGHFGGAGTFLWRDPDRDLALACLTDREFGPWSLDAWPALSDAVVQELE